ELGEHGKQDGLMRFEVTYRARLVRPHEPAVAGNIRRQNGGEPSPYPLSQGCLRNLGERNLRGKLRELKGRRAAAAPLLEFTLRLVHQFVKFRHVAGHEVAFLAADETHCGQST